MAYLGRTQLKASDIKLKAATTISGSSTNTVVLTWDAPNEQSLVFKVNGVTQNSTDFSIAGSPTTITLASGNFADGSVVEVVGINDIGTAIVPADGSVTRPKLATTGTPDGSKFLQDDMAWTTVDSLPSQTSQSGKFLTTNGSAASWGVVAGGGGIAGVQVYDSTSSPYTWNKSDRQIATGKTINRVLVEVQGSGGGGGSTVSGWGGGGGGAGGYAMKLIDVSSIATSTVTVGAGGAAATDGNAASWADGTNTVTGAAGSKGANGTNPGYGPGGSGGAGTGGDLNIEGMNGNGGHGYVQMGGASRFSGNKQTISGTGPNASADNYGHGGYGAHTGAGAIVVVWEIN